jgi:peptidoglycan hydrolase-like protein with peptidoglycan-binding domain
MQPTRALTLTLLALLAAAPARADTQSRIAQRLLGALGHDAGAVDGDWGPRSAAALAAFLAAQGQPDDGTLDAADIARLRAAAATAGLPPDPVAGVTLENPPGPVLLPPAAPAATATRYWFGRNWSAADWNGDGLQDVLYTGTMKPVNGNFSGEDTGGACGGNPCFGFMPGPMLFLQSPDGTFTEHRALFVDSRDPPGQSLARQNLVADYNADGRPDLYIADTGIGSHDGFRDSYFLSQPDGTWAESAATHTDDPALALFDHGAATGDIDGDGDMDIVLTELGPRLTCRLNDGTGRLATTRCGTVNAFGIELGDMDGDGDLDLVHAGHEHEGMRTGIAWNDGTGRFTGDTPLPELPQWGTVPEVSVWDLDADADLDIVLSRAGRLYAGTAIQILENTGDAGFASTLRPLLEPPPDFDPNHEANNWNAFVSTLRFTDADGDGLTDILLVADIGGMHAPLVRGAILRNTGGMAFTHLPLGDPANPMQDTDPARFISP